MTSNLKRSKFYFLAIAIFSFVLVLVSYNWNIGENIYRISRDFSNVKPSNIHLPYSRDHSIEAVIRVDKFKISTDAITKQTKEGNSTKKQISTTPGDSKASSPTQSTQQTIVKIENGNKVTAFVDNITKNDNVPVKHESGVKTSEIDENTYKAVSSDRNGTTADVTINNSKQNHTKFINNTDHSKISDKRRINQSDTTYNGNTSKSLDSVTDQDTKFSKNQTSSRKISPAEGTASSLNVTNIDNLKYTKKETQEILDKIQKLKTEILSDHRHLMETKKPKSTSMKRRPGGHIVHGKTPEPSGTERAEGNYQHTNERLRNLGLVGKFINPVLWMSNEAQRSNTKYDSIYSTATTRPDVCAGCFANSFKKLINEPDLCKGETDILLLITTTPSRKNSRDAIRNTWCEKCNSLSSKIKYVFVFGDRNDSVENADLLKESEQHHDIIQMNFHDTYANLTYKTISSFQWSQDYCAKANYVMKTDDDMYVNTELLPLLLKAAPSEKFIGGMCWGPSSPHRDLSSKWYVSFIQYRQSLFPSMCSGTGYVMSRDTVAGVLRQSPNVPFFHLEDVYVAICVKRLGITPVLLEGFRNVFVEFEPCLFRNRIITAHEIGADNLYHIWKKRKTCPKADLTPEMLYRAYPV